MSQSDQDREPATQTHQSPEEPALVDEKGAAVRVPPPFIFLAAAACGAGLDELLPWSFGLSTESELIGGVLIIFSVTLVILINGEFNKHDTAIEPWKPSTKLITTGFYRLSRNPIYVSFCLFNIGLGLAFDSVWIVLSFIPAAIVLYFLVITKEESYLERKFGDEYRTYKREVRRWI